MSAPGSALPRRFATTRWSLVVEAGRRGSPQAAAALEQLCGLYWYPVFAFVRRKGYGADEAQDLTQGFFSRLVEKGDLGNADRERGRFRSFLLTACRHFLANARDRAHAERRGGGRASVPIDVVAAEGRYQRSLADHETPERLFERQWGLILLGRVMDDLEAEYTAAGKGTLFDRLKGFLAAADDTGRHADAARDLGMTEGAVKVAVHRLRRRYREALKRRVADTVGTADDVEPEIRYLFRTLARADL